MTRKNPPRSSDSDGQSASHHDGNGPPGDTNVNSRDPLFDQMATEILNEYRAAAGCGKPPGDIAFDRQVLARLLRNHESALYQRAGRDDTLRRDVIGAFGVRLITVQKKRGVTPIRALGTGTFEDPASYLCRTWWNTHKTCLQATAAMTDGHEPLPPELAASPSSPSLGDTWRRYNALIREQIDLIARAARDRGSDFTRFVAMCVLRGLDQKAIVQQAHDAGVLAAELDDDNDDDANLYNHIQDRIRQQLCRLRYRVWEHLARGELVGVDADLVEFLAARNIAELQRFTATAADDEEVRRRMAQFAERVRLAATRISQPLIEQCIIHIPTLLRDAMIVAACARVGASKQATKLARRMCNDSRLERQGTVDELVDSYGHPDRRDRLLATLRQIACIVPWTAAFGEPRSIVREGTRVLLIALALQAVRAARAQRSPAASFLLGSWVPGDDFRSSAEALLATDGPALAAAIALLPWTMLDLGEFSQPPTLPLMMLRYAAIAWRLRPGEIRMLLVAAAERSVAPAELIALLPASLGTVFTASAP